MKPIISRVILRTRAAAPLAAFYETLLGLVPVAEKTEAGTKEGPVIHLREGSASGPTLLTLIASPQAPLAPRHAPGLFHTAFLFTDLEEWKTTLRRMFAMPTLEYHGAADHGVSWAVYLEDPDGNGVELAWDKPEAEWPWRGDRIQMVSHALPLRSILASEPATPINEKPQVVIGHVHLQTADLTHAQAYQKHLDLRVTQDSYNGAVFMARGMYHHHLAVNTWNTRGAAPRPPGATGLVGWDISVPGTAADTVWIDPAGAEVGVNRGQG